MSSIPLSIPSLNGNEWKYVKECLDTNWISSAGKFVEFFEEKISEYCGVNHAIACVNGTSALQISLKLAGVQQGDEVIIPSLTFIAPVNAISYNGAEPIFMDSDSHYNLDSFKTIQFINNHTFFKNGYSYNKNTKKRISAIIPVHIWGNAVMLDDLIPVCEERNITVIEDASESLGTTYKSGMFKGKKTGSIGKFGCLSFNGNKIITTGGGGMILTNDKLLAEKAKYLTTQAKNDSIRYIHDEVGYNFRLTNIQAALGLAQFEQLPEFLKKKKELHAIYKKAIKKIEGLQLADTPKYANNNHWINVLLINNKFYGSTRDEVLDLLKNNGVESRPIWKLNHFQKPYKMYGKYKIEKAISLVEKSLCIPSSSDLSITNINYIINILKKN
tara:strand:+ start:1593 stop:2753 length:1161 start_codon:yes stop_codon:yes gene_type:complete